MVTGLRSGQSRETACIHDLQDHEFPDPNLIEDTEWPNGKVTSRARSESDQPSYSPTKLGETLHVLNDGSGGSSVLVAAAHCGLDVAEGLVAPDQAEPHSWSLGGSPTISRARS